MFTGGDGLSVKVRIALWAVYYLITIFLGKQDIPSLPLKESEPFRFHEGSFNGRVVRTPRPWTKLHPGDRWRFQRAVEAARARVHGKDSTP